ncbi:uncharacterized protein LOC144606075 [Rhinoraja longicauda]
MLCDKGTQTEKCSKKAKQKRGSCGSGTQTELAFSAENLQTHRKLHCNIGTQTDRRCSKKEKPKDEVHEVHVPTKHKAKSATERDYNNEVAVPSEGREKRDRLNSQSTASEEISQGKEASTDPDLAIIYTSTSGYPDVKEGEVVLMEGFLKTPEKESADSDAEIPQRDGHGLIDASTQTEEAKPSDDHSDVGTFRIETFGETEGKTTTPNSQLDKAPVQLTHASVQTLPSDENPQLGVDVQTVISGLVLQSDANVQTEEIERMVLDSDMKTNQEPSEHEKHLQSDIQNIPSKTSDLSDLIYYEKEQCPCKMPKVKKEKLKWTIITPSILENGNKKFGISLPEKGYYECAVTGLRWITKSHVTLTYKYCSWNEYVSDVQKENWIIGSSLFNITIEAGSVEAVHLPHFICESGSEDAMYSAVHNVAHFKNNVFSMEAPSEVTLSHAILRNHPLGIVGIILCQVCQVAIHAIVLLYQTLQVDSSNFHVYVLPNDPTLIQAVELQENEIKSLKIQRPAQVITLSYGKKYKLTSFTNVKITPSV